MDIFEGVEKWISEHGSAQVLRDHVNFLRDRFAHLERESARLKKENDSLRIQNAELIGENAAMKDMRQRDAVTGDEEAVLKALTYAYNRVSAAEIARISKISEIRAQHALDELSDKEFIVSSGIDPDSDEGTTYSLDRKGRAYVVERGWA